jgi:hypothetical protein
MKKKYFEPYFHIFQNNQHQNILTFFTFYIKSIIFYYYLIKKIYYNIKLFYFSIQILFILYHIYHFLLTPKLTPHYSVLHSTLPNIPFVRFTVHPFPSAHINLYSFATQDQHYLDQRF